MKTKGSEFLKLMQSFLGEFPVPPDPKVIDAVREALKTIPEAERLYICLRLASEILSPKVPL